MHSDLVRFDCLTGTQFDDAITGIGPQDSRFHFQPPTGIRYYLPRRVYCDQAPDSRVFFIASIPAHSDPSHPREIIAMLEIAAHEGASDKAVGIKYVSTKEAYRKQGLGFHLYLLLAHYLKTNSLALYRTRPGRDTPSAFTASISRLLSQHQITLV